MRAKGGNLSFERALDFAGVRATQGSVCVSGTHSKSMNQRIERFQNRTRVEPRYSRAKKGDIIGWDRSLTRDTGDVEIKASGGEIMLSERCSLLFTSLPLLDHHR